MRDVIIIGAGPVGLACGVEAKRRDLDALLIEKGALCNSFIGYPTRMEFFSTPGPLEIGGHPFPTRDYKPRREEALDYYRRVATTEDLNLRLYEPMTDLRGQDGHYTVVTKNDTYEARKVVVATGFYDVPNQMGVPGEDRDKVRHYFKEPFPYALTDVAIVGGANSAVKAALNCYRHEANVTMVVRDSALDDGVKYWLRPDVENRIDEGSIDAYFDTTVSAIESDTLHLDTPDGPQTIDNDFVLAMTGYRPNYDFLERLGIAIRNDEARTPVHDEEGTFETNRDGLYLAGTICGGCDTSRWFIENGRVHAEKITDHIAATLDPEPAVV
ncbi:YpdA family putative bacillithiol disulfide reductase [Salinibacter ruber]|uniref:YpdA family putative bacillithiol disulfide reductase n=1 Tax=Salinibacter ruber TaxID=146919 RepID=UPI0020735BE3|nr:YpdA family putative bacillithiol disulfide reductase [Salinibacter ruber]MCS3700569.1 thioredoxin reductase (NADPH) [Salinibacter ruber]MCS3783652.1 thioredoxin reductase (NADPH) [Salinibacter ruber]